MTFFFRAQLRLPRFADADRTVDAAFEWTAAGIACGYPGRVARRPPVARDIHQQEGRKR